MMVTLIRINMGATLSSLPSSHHLTAPLSVTQFLINKMGITLSHTY